MPHPDARSRSAIPEPHHATGRSLGSWGGGRCPVRGGLGDWSGHGAGQGRAGRPAAAAVDVGQEVVSFLREGLARHPGYHGVRGGSGSVWPVGVEQREAGLAGLSSSDTLLRFEACPRVQRRGGPRDGAAGGHGSSLSRRGVRPGPRCSYHDRLRQVGPDPVGQDRSPMADGKHPLIAADLPSLVASQFRVGAQRAAGGD